MPITSRTHRRARLRRAGAVCAVAVTCGLLLAPAAQAAQQHIDFELAAYPAGYDWNGVGDPPKPEHAPTGRYWGKIHVDPHGWSGGGWVETKVQQIRGGLVLGVDDGYDEAAGKWRPVSVQPGDVFRLVREDDGAVLAETAFTGNPSVTSSVIGSTTVGGTRDPHATGLSVEHERRVPRTHRSTEYVPGTYEWTVRAKGDPADPDLDKRALDERDAKKDVVPPQPVLEPGQQAVLVQLTPGSEREITYEKRFFEPIGAARLLSVGETTFAAQLAQPLAEGDMVTAVQTSRQIAGDVQTTVELRVSAPAGIAPPADTTPPALGSLDLGEVKPTLGGYLKRGLTTFTAVGEPGTVSQELRLTVKQAAKGKARGKGRKSRRAKERTYVVGKATPVKASFAGQTVKLTLKADKAARKRLSAAGKKAKLKLVTTITDVAGNVTVSERTVTLHR